MKLGTSLGLGLGCIPAVFAAFGITSSGSNLLLDTGADLTITINTANGDITSLLYKGLQLQDPTEFTQVNSGLVSANVTSSVVGSTGVVTIDTGIITQYYLIRAGENTLYIGTYASEEPSLGLIRFIGRLSKAALPHGHPESEVRGGTAVEGSDVFMVDGETRSKFYSSVRFIEDKVHGVTGTGVGAYVILPGVAYETSSGGPFHRDVDNQGTDQQEVYFIMNGNHEQTDWKYRFGFYGPYALAITDGSVPSTNLNTSFFDGLGLKGYVPASGRGTVSGTYSGVLASVDVTIGFANDAAQYWTSGSGGSFTRDSIKPGIYNATLYQGELEAVTVFNVTVSAGKTTTLALASALDVPNTIWSIGTVDGTPAGFLNADLIESMHPSDTRMNAWGPVNFTIGTSKTSDFPLAQFRDSVNSPTTILWTPSSSEIGARTLRIRTTESFAGGRPGIVVNEWTAPSPAAPRKIDSRGVTRGTWRGLNQVYDYAIPNGTLTASQNIIVINIISGTVGSGAFLSPNVVFDSVELF